MSSTVGILSETGITLHGLLGFAPGFYGGVPVAHMFTFLCCVDFLFCLRPVSFVSIIACVSQFPILDYPFGFH